MSTNTLLRKRTLTAWPCLYRRLPRKTMVAMPPLTHTAVGKGRGQDGKTRLGQTMPKTTSPTLMLQQAPTCGRERVPLRERLPQLGKLGLTVPLLALFRVCRAGSRAGIARAALGKRARAKPCVGASLNRAPSSTMTPARPTRTTRNVTKMPM